MWWVVDWLGVLWVLCGGEFLFAEADCDGGFAVAGVPDFQVECVAEGLKLCWVVIDALLVFWELFFVTGCFVGEDPGWDRDDVVVVTGFEGDENAVCGVVDGERGCFLVVWSEVEGCCACHSK